MEETILTKIINRTTPAKILFKYNSYLVIQPHPSACVFASPRA